MRILPTVIVAISCSKSPPTSQDLARPTTGATAPIDGWYVSKSGVFHDRKLVVAADHLGKAGALQAALGTSTPDRIVFDLDYDPVVWLKAMLHDLDGRELELARYDAEAGGSVRDACRVRLSNKPIATKPALSLDIMEEAFWVGVVPPNEFLEIPRRDDHGAFERDWYRLETELREQKRSSALADRAQAELSIDGASTNAEALQAIYMACAAGFYELSVVAHEQLSAKVELPPTVDVHNAKTVGDVIAALRPYQDKGFVRLRVGRRSICDWMKVATPTKKPVKPAPATGYLVAFVRKNGSVWHAMKQTHDPSGPKTTEFADKIEEMQTPYSGTFGNMRLFTHVKTAPLELAAEDGVPLTAYLATITEACGGRTQTFELRAPADLSIKVP